MAENMEIDKTSSVHKETAWKIKLDKNVMLVLNAVEDSSLPEPNVSVILSEGDKKVSFTMTKDKFLNLTGVLDSFSQVCLGVEPVLAQEDYVVHEPKVPEKTAEKPEPPAKKVDEPRPAPPAPPARTPAPSPAPAPVYVPAPAPVPAPAAVAAKQPEPAKAVAAKQPEPAKAMTAESRMLAKLDAKAAKAPPKLAFPPRFPSAVPTDDEEPEEAEEAEDAEEAEEAEEVEEVEVAKAIKASEPMEDLAQLDFGIAEPDFAPKAEPAPVPVSIRIVPSPPAKPTPPPTAIPKITKEPAKTGTAEEEKESAPEWDPW